MAKRRRRRVFTAGESAEVWDRWQRGEGLKAIGLAIAAILLAMWSVVPLSPARR
jgi:hypothetical protein